MMPLLDWWWNRAYQVRLANLAADLVAAPTDSPQRAATPSKARAAGDQSQK